MCKCETVLRFSFYIVGQINQWNQRWHWNTFGTWQLVGHLFSWGVKMVSECETSRLRHLRRRYWLQLSPSSPLFALWLNLLTLSQIFFTFRWLYRVRWGPVATVLSFTSTCECKKNPRNNIHFLAEQNVTKNFVEVVRLQFLLLFLLWVYNQL